jgi:hypothetical protein
LLPFYPPAAHPLPNPPPLTEIQAFDGLAPEVINSRLAMLGFAVAAFFELTQGKDVFEQVKAYPLLTIATFVLFTTASWIPFLQGQSYNVKSGPFTPAVSRTGGDRGWGGVAKGDAAASCVFVPLLHTSSVLVHDSWCGCLLVPRVHACALPHSSSYRRLTPAVSSAPCAPAPKACTLAVLAPITWTA